MEGYFEIGRVTGARGVKGELRVYPLTDHPERFSLLDSVYVCRKNDSRAYEIEKVWYQNGLVILKLMGIDDMTQAEGLKAALLKIPPEKALPLEEDEYYIRDLYGIDVVTMEGEHLGQLTDIISSKANDVYSVTTADGKQLLIPAIKSCILKVDIKNSLMTVSLLEGLREL